MQKVTVQRTEYRQHDFEIPDGIEEGSDEWDEIINDFDWKNATLYHADESVEFIVQEDGVVTVKERSTECVSCGRQTSTTKPVGVEILCPGCEDDMFVCASCEKALDIEDSIRIGKDLYCDRCGCTELAKIERHEEVMQRAPKAEHARHR